MKQEFEEREWGVAGEFVIGPREPQVTRIERPRFPPPDWAEEERERAARERQEHALNEETPAAYPPPTRGAA